MTFDSKCRKIVSVCLILLGFSLLGIGIARMYLCTASGLIMQDDVSTNNTSVSSSGALMYKFKYVFKARNQEYNGVLVSMTSITTSTIQYATTTHFGDVVVTVRYMLWTPHNHYIEGYGPKPGNVNNFLIMGVIMPIVGAICLVLPMLFTKEWAFAYYHEPATASPAGQPNSQPKRQLEENAV